MSKFQFNKTPAFTPRQLPLPLGARVSQDGVRFTLFSRHATRVWLLLFKEHDAEKPYLEIPLHAQTHRWGDLWHVHVPKARTGQFYVWRLDGPREAPHAFNLRQWVLDPYAQAVSGSPKWGDTLGRPAGRAPQNGAAFPKGVIVDQRFDWGNDTRHNIPLNESIIYEAHMRGFTAHPNSGVKAPGTYEGFLEKIPYLKKMGITAVEFLPLHEFNEVEYHWENDPRKNLRNYWGYSTMNFFAPNARYCAKDAHGSQVDAFKEVVKGLHAAGMEAWLDVVYNHSCEGGKGGPITSFRGIDNQVYYMLKEHEVYQNFSGCGNTMNCNHPVVQDLILDSLRHWVQEYHIDGFRFDLATVLTRGQDGEFMPHPPVVDRIAEDPALRDTKLIAEAWDAVGGYQVGSFPSDEWSEWNGRYRDDMRSFWNGTGAGLGEFATRLCGSADLYRRKGLTPQKTINFICCHDGFTLRDLVSFNKKRNEANLEENRDGENHNHSRNFGVEGPSADPKVEALRKRQMKNLLATLFCSIGTPMLLAGDEFGQSQGGSNNAYCQDNMNTWLDWSRTGRDADQVEFVKKLIAFRKRQPALCRTRFFHDHTVPEQERDILWFSPEGTHPDWHHGRAIACVMRGEKRFTEATRDGQHVLLLINASEKPIAFKLPKAPGRPWRLALSTQEKPPRRHAKENTLNTEALSVQILTSRP